MRTARICLVCEIVHPEDPGGQGRQAFALAQHLLARNVAVQVVTRRNFPESSAAEVVEGVSIRRLEPTGLSKGLGWRAVPHTMRFLWLLFWHLMRTRHAYDLLLVQGVKGVLLPTICVAALFRKQCVVKIDSHAELAHALTPESMARMGLRVGSTLVRIWSAVRDTLLRRADAIIAISDEIRVTLVQRLGATQNIVRIPNGLALEQLTRRVDKAALRRELRLPAGTLVTYTGRLSRAKGLSTLLAAWREVVRERPDAHLLVVGGGDRSFDDCESTLRKYVRREHLDSHVLFIGQVPDVTKYLQASDVYVVCSESEGFGLGLVEAMAASLPCISTPVGVASEVIVEGTSGWLVPVGDAAATARVINKALASPGEWPEIGKRAMLTVCERFGFARIANQYVDLFTKLAAERTASAPSVRTNAAWLLGCRIGADAISLLLFVLISRRFGPEGVGVYAYGFALAAFVYSAMSLGIDEYGVREFVRRDRPQRIDLIQQLLGFQACIGVVTLAAFWIYVQGTGATGPTLTIIVWLTLYQLCCAIAGTLFVPAYAAQRMKRPGLILLVSRALGSVSAAVAIVLGYSLQTATAAFAVSGALLLGLAAQCLLQEGVPLRVRISMRSLGTTLRTLWSFSAADIFGPLITRVGVVVLTLKVGAAAAGVYAVGLKLVEVAALPLLFLGQASYPKLSSAFADGAAFRESATQTLRYGMLLTTMVAIAFALLVPWLIEPVLGEAYAGTELLIASMAFLLFAQCSEILLGRVLLAADLSVARARWNAVGLVACLVVTLLTAPAFGTRAAIAAAFLSYVIINVTYLASLQGVLPWRSSLRAGGKGEASMEA